MGRTVFISLLLCMAAGLLPGADEEFVFRSDVALVRVDAQVVDRSNRPITGLKVEDFVLLENGKAQEIRNFAREEMPIDILLLLDVSGSMQPHVSRVASAANDALNVLGPDDRLAIMVFDRATRVRLPFRKERSEIQRGLDAVLQQESFDGGTDITRGLHDAINYVARQARRDARRAIVILTDDQTERGRDEDGIARALENANTVLSALIAPDALRSGRLGTGGGTWPPNGPTGGPLGGIILGRRGPYGSRYPGPVNLPRTQSAGTSEIARRSGGESLRVDEASALETTLTRLRQRYALHFHLAEGVKPGQEGDLEVDLSPTARRRYPDAQVRFHRVHLSDSGGVAPVSSSSDESIAVSKGPAPASQPRRRPGVSGDSTRSSGPIESAQPQGGWRRTDETVLTPAPPASEPQRQKAEEQPKQGGWRRVKPGEEP
jgi:VWFA-related protein